MQAQAPTEKPGRLDVLQITGQGAVAFVVMASAMLVVCFFLLNRVFFTLLVRVPLVVALTSHSFPSFACMADCVCTQACKLAKGCQADVLECQQTCSPSMCCWQMQSSLSEL